ncbi:MAG: MFS transporter [Desulfobacca sp.]|uniref:MFS transporter n=1 Tax=Desulfobacca sp. TaxID=2067990 RepID=UPI00404A152A
MAAAVPPDGGTSRGLTLLAVCSGAFMATLDTSIVSITLPLMARDLGAALPTISWVMLAYLLVNASLLLSSSQLGDLLPPGRLFGAGMVIFATASAACGLSQHLWQLISARAVQGLGASLMLAAAPKIITLIYQEGERGLPFGLFSTAFASGVTVGAPLGGLIAAIWGWPWIFLINLPIAGLSLGVSGRSLHRLRVAAAGCCRQVDWPGGLLFSLSIAPFIYALTQVRMQGWQRPTIWGALGVAALAFGLLQWLERRCPSPLLPGQLWRQPAFWMGAITVVLTFAAVMGTFFLLPFYLVEIYHLPPQTVGWLLAVLSGSNALISPVGGLAGDRWGNLVVLRLGSWLILAGLAALWWWGPRAAQYQLVLNFMIIGLGFGLFQAPNLNEMLRGLSPRVLGLAAGSNAVLKNLGALLGIAALVTVATWGVGEAAPPAGAQCLTWNCFQRAFLIATLLAALNVMLNLLPRRSWK